LSMLVTAVVIFLWRFKDPLVIEKLAGAGVIYLLLVLSLAVMVIIIGWNGAAMTFPVEKE